MADTMQNGNVETMGLQANDEEAEDEALGAIAFADVCHGAEISKAESSSPPHAGYCELTS